jgi:hypothetical protein
MEEATSTSVDRSIYSINLRRYLEAESILKEFFDELSFCRHSVPNCLCDNYCCKHTVPGNYKFSDLKGVKELDTSRDEKYGKDDTDKHQGDGHNCTYSSNEGCILKTHKPPICASYLCTPGQTFLKQNNVAYDAQEIESKLIDILEGDMSEEDYQSFKKEIEKLRDTKLKVTDPRTIIKIRNPNWKE